MKIREFSWRADDLGLLATMFFRENQAKHPRRAGHGWANDSNGLSPLFTLSHKVFTCVSVSWLHSFNCSIHWSRSLVISLSSIVGDVAILSRPAIDFFPAHGGWLASAGLFHTRRTWITLSKTRGRAPNSIPPKNYNTAKSHRTRPLTRNSYYVLRKIWLKRFTQTMTAPIRIFQFCWFSVWLRFYRTNALCD